MMFETPMNMATVHEQPLAIRAAKDAERTGSVTSKDEEKKSSPKVRVFELTVKSGEFKLERKPVAQSTKVVTAKVPKKRK